MYFPRCCQKFYERTKTGKGLTTTDYEGTPPNQPALHSAKRDGGSIVVVAAVVHRKGRKMGEHTRHTQMLNEALITPPEANGAQGYVAKAEL